MPLPDPISVLCCVAVGTSPPFLASVPLLIPSLIHSFTLSTNIY